MIEFEFRTPEIERMRKIIHEYKEQIRHAMAPGIGRTYFDDRQTFCNLTAGGIINTSGNIFAGDRFAGIEINLKNLKRKNP